LSSISTLWYEKKFERKFQEVRLSSVPFKDALDPPLDREIGAAGRRAAKREALLAEAARLLNDRGAGAVSLLDLGSAVGLSRNALYYYVRDRDDLILQSYERACLLVDADLNESARDMNPGDAINAVSRFITLSLAANRPPAAVTGDVDVLPETLRTQVRALEARNINRLQTILREGVRSGQLRPHDDEVAAQCVIGMVSWALMSMSWLKRQDSPAMRVQLAAAFTAIVFDGIATDAPVDFPRIDLDALALRPFDPFDRRQSNEMKIQQVISAACRLFNRRGVDGTSLDDIASEVGVTKGVIYHYFRNKTDLVARCHLRALDLHEMFQAVGYAAEAPVVARIATNLDATCRAQIGQQAPLILQAGFMNLPDEVRSEIADRLGRLRQSLIRNVRTGVSDGSCKDIPAEFSAIAMTGIICWLPKWWTPDSGKTPDYIASEIVALVTEGLGVRRGSQAARSCP